MSNNRLIPTLWGALLLPLLAAAQEAAGPRPGSPPAPPTLAAGAKPEPPKPPTEAETLLDEAIGKVKGLKSVSSDVTQTVKMLGQQFTLKGQYVRAEPNRILMSLTLTGLGDARGTMLQVCDGSVLWDYSKILDAQNCQRLQIDGVMKALNSPDCDATLRESILTRLNFAGPETLLVGLRKSVEFNAKSDETIDGKAVWVLTGAWKDRASLTGPGQEAFAPGAPLPPYVPSLVTVYVGKNDGWPYQVRLRGRALSVMEMAKKEQRIGPDGRPIGQAIAPPKEPPSEIRLAYSNVELNPKLNPDIFAFQPPKDIRVDDITEKTMTELTSALNEMAARKKAEAAKSSSADLPASVTVPRLDPESPAPPAAGAPK